ncbi:MAG: hypothetical protein ACLTZO_04485 [Ruminococcus sp.]|jgi:hypothetical protein|nr:MAG TPA: hypothetical protein [Caudoviricetes sp.]
MESITVVGAKDTSIYKERQKRKHKAINLKMQINENTLLWHIPKQRKYALLDT